MQQPTYVAFINFLFCGLGHLHIIYRLNRLSYRNTSTLNVKGHVRTKENVILSEEREATLEGIITIAVKGGVGIEHSEVVNGVFREPRKMLRPETLQAIIIVDYNPVGEIRHHPSAVMGYELYGGKFFEDTSKNKAAHGSGSVIRPTEYGK